MCTGLPFPLMSGTAPGRYCFPDRVRPPDSAAHEGVLLHLGAAIETITKGEWKDAHRLAILFGVAVDKYLALEAGRTAHQRRPHPMPMFDSPRLTGAGVEQPLVLRDAMHGVEPAEEVPDLANPRTTSSRPCRTSRSSWTGMPPAFRKSYPTCRTTVPSPRPGWAGGPGRRPGRADSVGAARRQAGISGGGLRLPPDRAVGGRRPDETAGGSTTRPQDPEGGPRSRRRVLVQPGR